MSAVGHRRLVDDLRALGLTSGATVMVHTRMSALGWVIGGSETVVRALLDVLGPDGTLVAYVSWQEHVYDADDWPPEHRDAHRAQPPAFDVATAEAARDHGVVPERLRTWPGARRSDHPEAGVVALGARAAWLTEGHPPDDGYGAGSPFARFVAAPGQVLMLGAPLETISLMHHAEAICGVPGRVRRTFTVAVREGDAVTTRTYTDLDTSGHVLPYERLGLDDDEFAVIARAALAAGIGVQGTVGEADCHLFDAAALTAFTVSWLRDHFPL